MTEKADLMQKQAKRAGVIWQEKEHKIIRMEGAMELSKNQKEDLKS